MELHLALGDASLVVDFIEVKPLFKAACDTLDHRTLLPTGNAALCVSREGPGSADDLEALYEGQGLYPEREVPSGMRGIPERVATPHRSRLWRLEHRGLERPDLPEERGALSPRDGAPFG